MDGLTGRAALEIPTACTVPHAAQQRPQFFQMTQDSMSAQAAEPAQDGRGGLDATVGVAGAGFMTDRRHEHEYPSTRPQNAYLGALSCGRRCVRTAALLRHLLLRGLLLRLLRLALVPLGLLLKLLGRWRAVHVLYLRLFKQQVPSERLTCTPPHPPSDTAWPRCLWPQFSAIYASVAPTQTYPPPTEVTRLTFPFLPLALLGAPSSTPAGAPLGAQWPPSCAWTG